jgi:hypothetical protein
MSPRVEATMASSKVIRSHDAAQPGGRRINPHTKTRFYEAAYDLNRGFAITLEVFDRLAKLGLCRPERIREYRNMAEEVRALTNFQIAATLRDREEREMALYGRLQREHEGDLPLNRVAESKVRTGRTRHVEAKTKNPSYR